MVVISQMIDSMVKLFLLLNDFQSVVMCNHKKYRQLKGRKRNKRKINLDIMAYSTNLLTHLIVTINSGSHMPFTK